MKFHEPLRLEPPTLEPDEAFVERLAFVACSAPPATTPAGRWRGRGVRVGVATAAVAAISVGGAWATASFIAPDEPQRPPTQRPTQPPTHQSTQRSDEQSPSPGGTTQPAGPAEFPHGSVGDPRPGPRHRPDRGAGSTHQPPAAGQDQGPAQSQGQGQGQGQARGHDHAPGLAGTRPERGSGQDHGRHLGHEPGASQAEAPGANGRRDNRSR